VNRQLNSILVTGGAGYIGVHTLVQLLEAGYEVIAVDNLANSSIEAVRRAENIAGKRATSYIGDIRDADFLDQVFARHAIDVVIHFAGLKAVGESAQQPLAYYDNNVCGTVTLCRKMLKYGVRRIIFSSSATVYGSDAPVPYLETMPRGKPANPYGATKAIIEQLLTDISGASPDWSVVLLRYFNPIGAHPSGLLGDAPSGIPNNLLPYLTQVAVGKLAQLTVFGGDYDTQDGTCERDYLHVMDLADAHVKALQALTDVGVHIYNIGTGKALSVLEIINTFTAVTGQAIPYTIGPRRAGDLPVFWADAGKARKELNWQASRSLEQMLADAWRWQQQNPEGYP
jgi:UDP-glucose 4-epimerase